MIIDPIARTKPITRGGVLIFDLTYLVCSRCGVPAARASSADWVHRSSGLPVCGVERNKVHRCSTPGDHCRCGRAA
jgi:hypothetical protein